MENKWKNKNFFKSLKNALNGILYTIKTQNNIKIQIFFAVIVVLLGMFLKLTNIEWAILCITIFLVFFAELTNTAIEKVIDLYTEEYNEKAKIAKDVAAGAVTITAILSIIIGMLIILPKLLIYLNF